MCSSITDVRTALAADATLLHAIRRDRELWLAGRGIKQWGVGEVSATDIADQIEAGEWFVGTESSGRLLGGVRYLVRDDAVWPDAVDDPARYVHGLMTDRRRTTAGAGACLLSWAEARALGEGAEVMRLDCVETNHRLRRFYVTQGYDEVGRRDFDGEWFSAALFEKRLRPAEGRLKAPNSTRPTIVE